MTRNQRLRPVVRHNDNKEQRALREFAHCRERLDQELLRLDQLEDYKHEYLQQKKTDMGLHTPMQLQEFNRFLQQLDETIERQKQVVDLRQRELEDKRHDWNLTRIDSKKMHKIVDKLEHQELIELQRDEQKDQDELAQRKKSRR